MEGGGCIEIEIVVGAVIGCAHHLHDIGNQGDIIAGCSISRSIDLDDLLAACNLAGHEEALHVILDFLKFFLGIGIGRNGSLEKGHVVLVDIDDVISLKLGILIELHGSIEVNEKD